MERTDEQVARERAAVESMKGAKSNMAFVLERVGSLEYALRNAIDALTRTKGYVPKDAYFIRSEETLHAKIDAAIAAAQKAL